MLFFSACLHQTKQSPVCACCMFSVLLEYSAVVASPYIDIFGRWMMLFFVLPFCNGPSSPPFCSVQKRSAPYAQAILFFCLFASFECSWSALPWVEHRILIHLDTLFFSLLSTALRCLAWYEYVPTPEFRQTELSFSPWLPIVDYDSLTADMS